MDNNIVNHSSTEVKLIQSFGIILKLAGFIICGAAVTLFVFGLILGLNGQNPEDLLGSSNYNPGIKFLMLSMQGFNHLVSFIVLPLLYIHYFKKSLYPIFKLKTDRLGIYTLIAVIIIFSSIPLISLLAEWNKSIHLPQFFEPLERWMASNESKAEKLTELIAYFNNAGEFIIILFVMAILPAVGEELLFRGIIQNEFSGILKNPHIAIWLTGFIFSFIHLQFFGFFPRMLLGVTFGYLYYWSGNLIIPILVHFINNALTLIVMNLYKNKLIETDFESADSMPAIGIVISIIIFTFLLFTFSRFHKQRKNAFDEFRTK